MKARARARCLNRFDHAVRAFALPFSPLERHLDSPELVSLSTLSSGSAEVVWCRSSGLFFGAMHQDHVTTSVLALRSVRARSTRSPVDSRTICHTLTGAVSMT
jgi:hypothetical protein